MLCYAMLCYAMLNDLMPTGLSVGSLWSFSSFLRSQGWTGSQGNKAILFMNDCRITNFDNDDEFIPLKDVGADVL